MFLCENPLNQMSMAGAMVFFHTNGSPFPSKNVERRQNK